MLHTKNAKPHQKSRLQFLNFMVQNTNICIDIKHIKQVLPLMQLEPVPGSAASLVGLMNLAGESIPVIDLAVCLGLERIKKYSIDAPVLLCHADNHSFGLIIDAVFKLEETDEQSCKMSNEFKHRDSPFRGVLETEQGLSLLLNPGKVFRSCMHQKSILRHTQGERLNDKPDEHA